MASEAITARAAGTWTLGDLTVNRIGLGAMRLTGNFGLSDEEMYHLNAIQPAAGT